MRNAFINTLDKITTRNKNVMVLSGDLGYTVFEKYIEKHPRQFINMGVGEANMMGMAAGLAREGRIVIVYSIIPFITLRCYEQLRNDVCSHNVNVKVIGVGSGLGYAHLGVSHHAGEDISIMRTLPNMTVLVPADAFEVSAALTWALKHLGPVYIRLGKVGEPQVHQHRLDIKPKTNGFNLKKGNHLLILASGTIVYNALRAAEILEKRGFSVQVVSVTKIKPLEKNWVKKMTGGYQYIFTVEEHSIIGGLGSAIAEILLETGISPVCFGRIGIQDEFCRTIGNYEYTRDSMGLSPEKIVSQILTKMASIKKRLKKKS